MLFLLFFGSSAVLGILIVVVWLWLLWRYRTLTASFPPCDLPILPIIGQSYIMKGRGSKLVKTIFNSLKERRSIFWLGPYPYLFISEPEDMATILKSQHTLNRPDVVERLFGPLFKGGLILSKVAKWQLHRKIMGPAFSTRNINAFIPKINENITELITIFDQIHGNFNVRKYFLEISFKMNSYIFKGIDYGSKDCKFDLSESVTAANTCMKILQGRTNKFWLHPHFIFKMSSLYQTLNEHMNRLEHIRDKVLDERIVSKQNFGVNKEDFLGFLLDASEKNPKFTVQEVRNQLMTFLFAGFETTATTAAFALLALAHHPDIQNKLYHELEQFLPDPNQAITMEILDQLNYLDMVTKETLRYFTVVPVSGRVVAEPVVLSDGRVIPAGTTVIIAFHLTHRDKNHWPNAEIFDPERFSPENSEKRHPFAFLPFSGGKRNCIGSKMGMTMTKIILAKTIRKFHVTTHLTWADVTNFQYGVSLSIPRGFQVQLKPWK